ncbi:MAG: alcohol dehydrogenase catalytic domain-containing protein [bacterium]|nr:alcohol dehydrogenase catalytic domain-containing protein [bacterium]
MSTYAANADAPRQMRAAVVGEDGSISSASVPIPVCGPHEVLLRVDACGLCGSDLHARRGGRWARGLIPGHEIAGRIESLGESVGKGGDGQALTSGLAVVVEPLESCSRCRACQAGRDSICPDLRIAGVHRPGGFAEFVVVPAKRVFAVDPSIDPAIATLVEPLAVALHALDRAEFRSGERVLVLGGGTIGLLCAFAARTSGASEVVIRARYAHQRQLALDLGMARPHDAALSISQDGLESRFDLVIETVGGSNETLIEACQAANPGARVVVLGIFDRDPPFDPSLALQKEIGLSWGNCYQTGTMGDPDFARAARGLAEHRDSLGPLVTHRATLEGVDEAFDLAGNKAKGVGKLVVLVSDQREERLR